jgi:hypothetical protein
MDGRMHYYGTLRGSEKLLFFIDEMDSGVVGWLVHIPDKNGGQKGYILC